MEKVLNPQDSTSGPGPPRQPFRKIGVNGVREKDRTHLSKTKEGGEERKDGGIRENTGGQKVEGFSCRTRRKSKGESRCS